MKRVDRVIQHIADSLNDKDVLEVACGCAEFSYAASNIAKTVTCIDIDDTRIKLNISERTNLKFQMLDATEMNFVDDLFDTAVLYNAVGHLEGIIEKVLSECRRVVKPNGDIYLISSFKMDKWFLRDTLLRRLHENVEIQEIEPFLFVKIKNH